MLDKSSDICTTLMNFGSMSEDNYWFSQIASIDDFEEVSEEMQIVL